ncbi:MAG TPA: hypothetical protein VGD21_04065 [Lysobacter sp.]
MAIRPLGKWLLRWGSLALAVAPTSIALTMFFRAWALADHAVLDRPFWPIVVLQLCAIAAFGWHALGNKRLEEGGAAQWIVQFVVIIPFGTIDYWRKYLWPNSSRP